MSISMRKLTTLSKKDIIDFFKNPVLYVSILLPVVFVVFYKLIKLPNMNNEIKPIFLINMGTLMNCSMCGILIASTSIAEEKEKFTLRTLMLSNVSGMEFLISKVIAGFLLTVFGNILIFFLAGVSVGSLPGYLFAVILGSVSINIISAVLGLISRDQMSCGVMQIPVMLLLILPPIFGELNPVLGNIARVTPLNAMMSIYFNYADGSFFSGKTLMHLLVLLAWIAAAALIFILVYRKKGLDN